MTKRTERIEARLEPERAERIRLASSLMGTSMSGFVVNAAADKAEQVITEASYTVVPSDYFERLLAALDAEPSPIAALAKAAGRVQANPAFKQV